MASWREIERIRKDPAAVRALARALPKLYPGVLTDWEIHFLESVASNRESDEYTTRQAEKLLEIRDDNEIVTKHLGFSVGTLIQRCYEARLDLSEADEEWIAEI